MFNLIGLVVPRINIICEHVCVKLFLDEISIWIGGLSKLDYIPQWRQALSNPSRAWIEQKAEEGGIFPFLNLIAWAGTLHVIFSCPRSRTCTIGFPDSQAFGLSLNHTSGFPCGECVKDTISVMDTLILWGL